MFLAWYYLLCLESDLKVHSSNVDYIHLFNFEKLSWKVKLYIQLSFFVFLYPEQLFCTFILKKKEHAY